MIVSVQKMSDQFTKGFLLKKVEKKKKKFVQQRNLTQIANNYFTQYVYYYLSKQTGILIIFYNFQKVFLFFFKHRLFSSVAKKNKKIDPSVRMQYYEI